MIFKGPNGRIYLLVETAHPLRNVRMDAVPERAGTLLLGFIGLTVQGTAVLKFPDAEVA
jgi:hypothetical protein